MRELKYHIYLDDNEYHRVIESLMALKNKLIQQGRYMPSVLLVEQAAFFRKKIFSNF